MNRYDFRRQFILGPVEQAPDAAWTTIRTGRAFLHAHPDLNVTHVRSKHVEVILLGYIFDAFSPARTDEEIVRELSDGAAFSALTRTLSRYGGTFAVVYRNATEWRLIQDAGGLREVHFTVAEELYAATQPELLREYVELSENRNPSAQAFMASEAFRRYGGIFPGDRTCYEAVRRLRPNHYLDLNTGASVRWWPASPRGNVDVEEAASRAAEMLRGFLEAAANRFSLSLGVTAGWDSRVLLAASRSIKDDVDFFTVQHPGRNKINRTDLKVARRLAVQMGVPLDVRPYSSEADPHYAEAFRRSISHARENVLGEWYHVFQLRHGAEMSINGNVSEVARQYFERETPDTPEKLSILLYGSAVPYVVEVYSEWLEEVTPRCARYGYDVMDLFYWEERIGNWGAKGRSEVHLVTEMYSPFDCLHLLELLMAVDRKERDKFGNRLYRMIVEKLWPGGMREPVNPRLKVRVGAWMKKLGVYGAYSWARLKLLNAVSSKQ